MRLPGQFHHGASLRDSQVGFGLLLYTASSDAEGTLGGLVQAGRRIAEFVRLALELGSLCSNDPVCGQHDPENVLEGRMLHGAACHGCVLIAETSCEQTNDFLDRAFVTGTVAGAGTEFFEQPVGQVGSLNALLELTSAELRTLASASEAGKLLGFNSTTLGRFVAQPERVAKRMWV